MHEREGLGVQQQTIASLAVEAITDDGNRETMCAMYAELVRTASQRNELDASLC